MSHAMAHTAGIGAHGLWSVSRGLARGLKSRSEYKQMMDYADTPRQNDLDGRGNLSLRALKEFTLRFLNASLNQVTFMSGLFEIEALAGRLKKYVAQSETLKPESSRLLEEALIRGEYDRGEAERITGLPERTARRVLNDVVAEGLLASATLKGPVSLRFPTDSLEISSPGSMCRHNATPFPASGANHDYQGDFRPPSLVGHFDIARHQSHSRGNIGGNSLNSRSKNPHYIYYYVQHTITSLVAAASTNVSYS